MHEGGIWLGFLVTSILLVGSVADIPKREWNITNEKQEKARAVQLAEDLLPLLNDFSAGDEFWMFDPSNKALAEPGKPPGEGGGSGKPEESNTTTPSTLTTQGRKKREDAATDAPPAQDVGNSTGSGNSTGRAEGGSSGNVKVTSSGDRCLDSTVIFHYYLDGPGDTQKRMPIIISDLTYALKMGPDGNCMCAESGTTHVDDESGRKICIKKEKLGKGKECIHHKECDNTKYLCIFDAEVLNKTNNGDLGDIEDTRRFCSGSSSLVPALILLTITIAGVGARMIP